MGKPRATLILLASTVLSLAVVGCNLDVKGTHLNYMKYQPEQDSFELLHLWNNISCEQSHHLNDVESLWNRRDAIVVSPLQLVWSVPVVERLDDHKYRWGNLTSVSRPQREHSVTDLNLAEIQITPMEFYLNKHGYLCSVQKAVIPGQIMEVLLATFFEQVIDEKAKLIEQGEPEFARNPIGPRPSWDDLRSFLLGLVANEAGEKELKIPNSFRSGVTPLDAQSRDRLRKAKELKSIKLTRVADRFSWILPLSPVDTHEAIDTFNLFQNTFKQHADAGKRTLPFIREWLDAISLNAGDAGVNVTIDFSALAKSRMESYKSLLDLKPSGQVALKYLPMTVKSVRDRGIPIHRKLDIDDLAAKYQNK